MNYLILFPIGIPMLMGVILLACKKLSSARALGIYGALTGVLTLAAMLFVSLQNGLCLRVFTMAGGLSIYFCVDGMSKLFGILGCFLWIVVSVYSIAYFEGAAHLRRYYAFFLFALSVIMALCEAGSVITMYLCFELMTLCTFPFVLHEQTGEAILAAFKYIFFSICGAMTALAGIFFLYQYTDSLDFAAGGIINAELMAGHEQVVLVAAFLTIIGFGAKAGMLPLHAWLPVAHPASPAPASALLSGFIAKCGVLAISRMVFYVVGADTIYGTWVQYAWMILSLVTVFMGSMLAYREKVLKKRLAYSTVSQISYILFGLSTLNGYGLLGGYMHVIFHALVKACLFLFAGVVIHQTGKTRVADIDGLGKRMPVTYVCFTLVSITLVGIPPTSAFMSKLYLCRGALNTSIPWVYYTGIGVLMLSALLTAGYLLSITVRGFYYPAVCEFAPPDGEVFMDADEAAQAGRQVAAGKRRHVSEPAGVMLAPMILLTALAIGLGLYLQPLMEFLMSFIPDLV